MDNAGFFSFMTFSWMTTLAFTAYKKGQLLLEDVWPLSKYESSELNSRRYEYDLKAIVLELPRQLLCHYRFSPMFM